MTVLQLFPTFARLLAAPEAARPEARSPVNSAPPRLHTVVASPDPRILKRRSGQIERRLREATDILLEILSDGDVMPPLFPRSAREAYQVSLSSQVTVNDLTRILERDPALSMRLLRMANEDLISPLHPCRSIHEALMRVGVRPVRHLLMRATSDRLLVIPDNQGLTERLQGRAPSVARCSRRIARRIGADVNVAFTAGLLHDIGWAITFDLLRNYPDHFPDWVHEERTMTWQAIAEYSHQLLGATLARSWDLPTPVVAAIAFHHHPEEAGEPEAEMAYIVSVANTLCDHLDLYPQPSESRSIDWSSALAIGVDPEHLQRDSVGLGRSLRQDLDCMAIGVWRPGLGQKRTGRGLGVLDDGLEDFR